MSWTRLLEINASSSMEESDQSNGSGDGLLERVAAALLLPLADAPAHSLWSIPADCRALYSDQRYCRSAGCSWSWIHISRRGYMLQRQCGALRNAAIQSMGARRLPETRVAAAALSSSSGSMTLSASHGRFLSVYSRNRFWSCIRTAARASDAPAAAAAAECSLDVRVERERKGERKGDGRVVGGQGNGVEASDAPPLPVWLPAHRSIRPPILSASNADLLGAGCSVSIFWYSNIRSQICLSSCLPIEESMPELVDAQGLVVLAILALPVLFLFRNMLSCVTKSSANNAATAVGVAPASGTLSAASGDIANAQSDPSPSPAPSLPLLAKETLALHRGSLEHPERPIYIAILGTVYDVSKSRDMYQEGQAYNIFCGREAAVLLATSSLTEIDTKLDELSEKQLKTLAEWEVFFQRKYPRVGRLAT